MQTITGFAFALVAMGTVAAADIYPLAELTFIISALSVVNTTTALKGSTQLIDRRLLKIVLYACIPSTAFSLWLLTYLSADHHSALKLVLGATLLLFGILMMIKPRPLQHTSGRKAVAFSGFIAGFSGGLFATYGPPIALLFYRQPLPLQTIIKTLLAVFWCTALIRIGMVTLTNSVNENVYWLLPIMLPWVVFCTWVSKKLPMPFSELSMRRLAFLVVMTSGASIIWGVT